MTTPAAGLGPAAGVERASSAPGGSAALADRNAEDRRLLTVPELLNDRDLRLSWARLRAGEDRRHLVRARSLVRRHVEVEVSAPGDGLEAASPLTCPGGLLPP